MQCLRAQTFRGGMFTGLEFHLSEAFMYHNDEEFQKRFIDHLNYLMRLGTTQQWRRPDYKQMKDILIKNDHWKAKSRGKLSKSFIKKRFF